MANRRMFSLDVVDTDKFMEMPLSAQALYFHLGMRADDDGFISSPRRIMKTVECKQDDLKILIAKGYIIPFESGVIVITHWKQNNYLRSDRYNKTLYVEELSQLEAVDGVYSLVDSGVPAGIPKNDTGKDSIDKGSIEKDSIEKDICPEPKASEPESGLLLPLVDKTVYNIPVSKLDKWKEAYPAVDVEQECRKMAAWLDANPKRKKTRRGVDRFINIWLSREQDKGGRYKNGQQEPQRQQEYDRSYTEMYKDLPPIPPEEDPFK